MAEVDVRFHGRGVEVYLDPTRGCAFSGAQPEVKLGGRRLKQMREGGLGLGHGFVGCSGPAYELAEAPARDATLVVEHGGRTRRVGITRERVGLARSPEPLKVRRGERFSLRIRPGTTGVGGRVSWRSAEDTTRRESYELRTRVKGDRATFLVPEDAPVGKSSLSVRFDPPVPEVDCPATLECRVHDVQVAESVDLLVQ